MFLICNGILAFLAKSLFIITTTTTSSDSESLSIVSFESLEEVGDVMADEEYYEEKVEEHEEGTLYIQNEGIDEEGGTESEIDANVLAQDDDDGEETTLTTNEELVSTEELNRKFEEFIRRMKEEMKIEAQTHLIAV